MKPRTEIFIERWKKACRLFGACVIVLSVMSAGTFVPLAWGQDATVVPGRDVVPPAVRPGQPPPPQGGQEVWNSYYNYVRKYYDSLPEKDKQQRTVPGVPTR
ncbi:MAG: hypothetical protein AB1473_14200 [Thermodesulfobacteriota bacterium]